MASDAHATYLRTFDEAAARLHVSRSTLERMHRRDEGPPRTLISGRAFYTDASLAAFILQRTEKVKQMPDDLAALIEADLIEHFPHDVRGLEPFIHDLSAFVASLRQVDLNVLDGSFTAEQAQLFIQGIMRLFDLFTYLTPATRKESLAAEIVAAALRTAAANFPELLEESR